MDVVEFLKFLLDERASRICHEKRIKEGYFEQYPDRKELFEDMEKREIDEFIKKNPEAIVLLQSIKRRAQKSLEEATAQGKEEIADSDKFMIADVDYILETSSFAGRDEEKELIDIDSKRYQTMKILSETRCCALFLGALEGSKHIIPLLKEAPSECIEKASEIAKKIDSIGFKKGYLARDLDLQIFRAGLKGKMTGPEFPDEK